MWLEIGENFEDWKREGQKRLMGDTEEVKGWESGCDVEDLMAKDQECLV